MRRHFDFGAQRIDVRTQVPGADVAGAPQAAPSFAEGL